MVRLETKHVFNMGPMCLTSPHPDRMDGALMAEMVGPAGHRPAHCGLKKLKFSSHGFHYGFHG